MSQNNSHTVTILAKDGASGTFRVIGQSATQAAQQITSGTKAATAGLQQVDAAALKAQGSFAGLRQRAGG